MAVAALLFTPGAFAIPQPAAAQAFGGYADSLVFTTIDQGATDLLSAGEIDTYTGPLAILSPGGLSDHLRPGARQRRDALRGPPVHPEGPARRL